MVSCIKRWEDHHRQSWWACPKKHCSSRSWPAPIRWASLAWITSIDFIQSMWMAVFWRLWGLEDAPVPPRFGNAECAIRQRAVPYDWHTETRWLVSCTSTHKFVPSSGKQTADLAFWKRLDWLSFGHFCLALPLLAGRLYTTAYLMQWVLLACSRK